MDHTYTKRGYKISQKIGGILTLMNGIIGSRSQRINEDKYGRWCITKHKIGNKYVAIINIYCPGTAQKIGINSFVNQIKMELKRNKMEINNIHKWYFEDLDKQIKKLIKNKMELLCAGDFNIENQNK